MVDRYWRSGSTNWSASASWSSSPGGGGGAVSIPNVNDDVYFLVNATVSSGGGTCRNLNIQASVSWSSTTAMTIGASTTAGTGNLTIDGTLTHTGSATFTVNGDLQINGTFNQTTTAAGTITMSGTRECSIYQNAGALNKLTINKSNSNVNVYLNSTLYVNYTKTSGNGTLSHVQGHLRQQYYEIYCTIFAGSSGRQHEMSGNIVVFCTTPGITTINLVSPVQMSNRDGSYITRGFTVSTTVAMGSFSAATAFNLRIEDDRTVTVSGNVASVGCDGTMTGSLTVFGDFLGFTRNRDMLGLTLTYGVTGPDEFRSFYWEGQIGAINFSATNGTTVQTGCTYDVYLLRVTGFFNASSGSTTYNFNDVRWTATAAQFNGSSSYYTFGGLGETKWTTGGLTCSGNASTYDFNDINPTGTSTLTAAAASAVAGVGATYNFNYVRGTAALSISCSGATQNIFNIVNVSILGDFTFTSGELNLDDQWLYVAGFNTSSSARRTINFKDRRIVTSGSGAFNCTTTGTNTIFDRGVDDSGGIQLGGSGSSVFGNVDTDRALRVWIERPGGTTTITSGNIRNLVLNNGTVNGTVNITVESISSETDTSVSSSGLTLTLSTEDLTYQTLNWTRSSFARVDLTGVGVWTVQNLTASILNCSASDSAFYIGFPDDNGAGYCNITGGAGAVTLSGSNNLFSLFYVAGRTLAAQLGIDNYYMFDLRSGDGRDGGFSISMTIGSTSGAGSVYDLLYVRQTGFLSCAGTSGFSTYNLTDVQIRNAAGVSFVTRGNLNLYGDLYTVQLNIGSSSDGQARTLNFNPDGGYFYNIYVSANVGSTMLNMSNLTALTIVSRADPDNGIIIVNNWFGTGAGSIALATSGILAQGANIPSIRIDGVKPSCGTGSVYDFKNYRGAFDTAGGISNTGQTITVYGGLYISDTPFFPDGSIGVNTFVSTNFVMGRTDSATQDIQTASDQGYGSQSLRIGQLSIPGLTNVRLIGYTQVTTLAFSNGTINLNGNQLYVQTSVTVTSNANQKTIQLTDNDIYIAATAGTVWTCTDTNNITCTGNGNVIVRGGTVNSGGTTRKYNDQVNFSMTGEAAYTLTSPFTCRNLVMNNYTPPASWTLYVGGSLAWNWQNAWATPTGTVNFFATGASAYVSSNAGLNASYSLPTINVQNGTQLNVAGAEVTFGTLNCTGNSTFRLLGGNAYSLTLLNVASGSTLDLIGTLVIGGSGGTQTTSGLYMAPGSSLLNNGGTIAFNGAGEKYLTLPTGSTISNLQNGGAFNSGTLTGYLNMYNSFTVGQLSNTVNPSGFRQQTAGSTISVGTFSVIGTGGAMAYWRNPATANMIKTTPGNVSVDYIDVAFSTVTGNGSGQLWYAGNNGVNSGNNVGWIFSGEPTYVLSISGGATSVVESNSFTVVLTTTNVANGNVPYTITGANINSADIGGASLTGNFTLSSGNASVTFNVTADGVSEGTEAFTLSLDNGKASISINLIDIAPIYSLSIGGGLTSVNEGDNFTVLLTTTYLPDGTLVPYTITGTNITSADISGVSLTGNFTTAAGSASSTFVVASDRRTEGPENLTLTLNGPKTAVSISIVDTSKTPGADGFFMFFPI